MTSRTKSYLKYGFSAFLTLFFLYVTFAKTDFEKLFASMRNANYWWMMIMFGCLMASHILRSWRWRFLLDPIKANIRLRNLFSGVMVGYLMNNVFPRAGEIVRPYTIGKLESIPKSAAFGTVVVERILDTASFLLLVLFIPVVYDGPLLETFPMLENAGIVISAIIGVLFVLMVTLVIRRDWTDALLGVFRRFLPANLFQRIDKITHSFLDGFLFIKRPGNFLIILVLSFCVWFLYILMMYFAFYAFELQGELGLRAALVVQAISSIGFAMPTPGATGSYHYFATETLNRLYHIPQETALSYATVTHAVGFIGITIVGLYFFLQDHIKVSEAVKKGIEGSK